MNWSWKRASAIVVVLVGFACCGLQATPVEPDLDLLLKTPRPIHQFTPARAGWNGPESAGPGGSSESTALDRYSPEASALAFRRQLEHLAIPDWRFAATIALLILMLRALRQRAEQRPRSMPMPSLPNDHLIPHQPEAVPEELNPAA